MADVFEIAVSLPRGPEILTYIADGLKEGDLVKVPVGKRESTGLVLGPGKACEDFELKSVTEVLPVEYRLSARELELYRWISKYYHYPLGKVVADAHPKVLKRPRKAKELAIGDGQLPHNPNSGQQEIIDAIVQQRSYHLHYVHGVTGSGKALVFLAFAIEVLKSGKSVQILLPEINLTPQFLEFYREHLPAPVFIYHSQLSASEKLHTWQSCRQADKPVVLIGVRSSIFVGIPNLGAILVDEEHDGSFKQQDRCMYHARDVAVKKATIHNVPIVLASATPSVEWWWKVQNSAKSTYHRLTTRVGEARLPKLNLVQSVTQNAKTWPFAPEALERIEYTLARGRQAIVFVNRLGFSRYLQCQGCGERFVNKNCGCEIALRFFRHRNMLKCSFCDYRAPAPSSCPECGCLDLSGQGYGSERIESYLQKRFEDTPIYRFDRDRITTMSQLEDTIRSFRDDGPAIMVGTQMVAKGHNFPKVDLVVVLGIDDSLNTPDYRCQERGFQLLTQVMGRAGRFSDQGEVLVQTLRPENQLFSHLDSTSDEFYQSEIQIRQEIGLPPFTRVAVVYATHREAQKCKDALTELKHMVQDVNVLGPAPVHIEIRQGKSTWHLMMVAQDAVTLQRSLSAFNHWKLNSAKGIDVKLDVDPVQVLI